MKKIAFVFGTRPEAIKLAPLILRMRKEKSVQTLVCVTGQHKEMLYQVLGAFGIKPDADLDLMSQNQSLAGFFAKSLKAISTYLEETKPDYVIVQGDTSTVLSAAMAAFYNKIKVLHIEAGLRTNDFYSPFPEEMNRRLTTGLSHYHFAPTEPSKANLLKEGIDENTIWVTGNTAIDALLSIKEKLEQKELPIGVEPGIIESLGKYKRMVLITGHRRENFGDGFLNICEAIKRSANANPDCLFIYPVHLNPNVKDVVFELLEDIKNVKLIPPQSYVDFIYLMTHSYLILTDSGGVQEEAPSLNKPILVMRESTERPEGVDAGCSLLVGTSVAKITSSINKLLNDAAYYQSFSTKENPYGDGMASERIIKIIQNLN